MENKLSEDIALFDFDFLIYEAVSVAEEKFITATHKPTGQVMEFENKTELWGDWRKKEGGWIGVQNALFDKPYWKAEDFEVVQGQRPRPFRTENGFIPPFEGAKKILDDKIKAICKAVGVSKYYGYTGTGETFRQRIATLMPYKGQREDMLRPLLLDEMKDYVIKQHNCQLVHEIEADDAVSIQTIAGYEAWKKLGRPDTGRVIAVAIDKDAKQTSGWHYNPDKDKEPRLIEGFGDLWINEQGDVDGCGRMWLYFQVAAGDVADNYKPNCFSDVRYAGKKAYSDLKECEDDKQAFTALVKIFKTLYPEKKVVEAYAGKIEIDWLYVMQEMFSLAMMLRKPGDKIIVKDVLDKLEIDYAN